MRGACFVARHLKVVAVAGLLWILLCVLGAAGFRFCFFVFFFERTRPAASMRPPCLIYLFTSTGQRTVHSLRCLTINNSLAVVCVLLCMCNNRAFYCLRELYEVDFHKPGIYGSEGVWANACVVFRRTPSRAGRGRRAAVNFVVCFGCGGISFFSFFFCSNARGRSQV